MGYLIPCIVHSVGRIRWTIPWYFLVALAGRFGRNTGCWAGHDLAPGKSYVHDSVGTCSTCLDIIPSSCLCHPCLLADNWFDLCHGCSCNGSQPCRTWVRVPGCRQMGLQSGFGRSALLFPPHTVWLIISTPLGSPMALPLFWIALISQLIIVWGYFWFYRKEQLGM